MAEPTDYNGSQLQWPVRITPQHKDNFQRGDNRGPLNCRITAVLKQTWVNAATIVTNGVSVSHAGASSAGTTNMTLGGSLTSGGVATFAHARNVVITVTHGSSIVAMSGTITGTRLGYAVTEAWSVTATGTSKTFTGKKAFDTVTSITETIAATAAANTIIAGNGKVLGLDFKAGSIKIIAEEEDGAAPTAGAIVAASTVSTADLRGTYTPNSTLNGALDFSVWYLSDDLAAVN